jgi:hypothetical protein
MPVTLAIVLRQKQQEVPNVSLEHASLQQAPADRDAQQTAVKAAAWDSTTDVVEDVFSKLTKLRYMVELAEDYGELQRAALVICLHTMHRLHRVQYIGPCVQASKSDIPLHRAAGQRADQPCSGPRWCCSSAAASSFDTAQM